MGIININPEAEVSTGFSPVKAGTYRMRIVEIKDRNPEKNDLEIKLAHTVPTTELLGLDGQPLQGTPSSVFDYIMLDHDKQWKFRTITEACGLPWQAYDPVIELLNREVDVTLKLDTYQGEQRNKVSRYVVPK